MAILNPSPLIEIDSPLLSALASPIISPPILFHDWEYTIDGRKKIIINKLNKASKLSTFLKTNKGFQVTGEEGYVAIDRKGNTVKLVDRLEFSYSNFNPEIVKGWTNDNRR